MSFNKCATCMHVITDHMKRQYSCIRRNPSTGVPCECKEFVESEIERVDYDTVELENDPVHHPVHYTSHPSGIECISVTKHFNFCLGNAIKYIWRADLKGNAIEDLEKAAFYINAELERRKNVSGI